MFLRNVNIYLQVHTASQLTTTTTLSVNDVVCFFVDHVVTGDKPTKYAYDI
jgi:hypothetical protein